ncbi:MAG: hypothetical protein ACOH1T_03790 [Microbacteriaceae bacterium]
MIVVGLLLAALGVADIVRASTRSLGWGIAAGALVFAIGTGVTGVGAWWAWSLAGVAATAAWVILTRGGADARAGRRRAAKTAVAGLALAVVVVWGAAGSIVVHESVASRWLNALPVSLLTHHSLTTVVVVLGAAIFLVESANVVVRVALSSTDVRRSSEDERLRQWLVPGETDRGGLKGGRLIGPFERLFILALALAGQYTAIGAIVAAKGIIRFPEISRNDINGSKAEEFLVGSFASWSLVLASVLAIISTLA